MRPLFAILPFLMAPANDPATPGAPPASGGATDTPDPAAALAALEDKTLPMSQRLDVAFKALKGIDPTNQLAAVKKQLAEAQASVALKDAEIEKIKGELSTANKQLEARHADVKGLEEANAKLEKENKELSGKEQNLEKRATEKANERVATLGFPASKLPAATEKVSDAANLEDLKAKFEAETDPMKKAEARLKLKQARESAEKQSKN